jgi:hypothetical protein
VGEWHPILAAVEDQPGVWRMVAQYGRCYGIVCLVKRGKEVGYRATTWAERAEEIELVGYFRTLRAATWAVHYRYIRSHSPTGFAPDPWNSG